jgi:hypothetical protein
MTKEDFLFLIGDEPGTDAAFVDSFIVANRTPPEPAEVSATGNPLLIRTSEAQNAISTILSFSPNQSGSGTPSPQNIRPIEGWTEVGLGVNSETPTITIDLGGTYYGGTIDLENGTLAVDYEYNTILSTDLLASDKNYCSVRLGELGYVNRDKKALCNMLTQWDSSASNIPVEHFMVLNSNAYNRAQANILFDGCKGMTPAETLALNKAYLEALEANDDYLTLCFPLAEPITYNLTPQTVALLKGNNTLWTDGDSIKITYTGYPNLNRLEGRLTLNENMGLGDQESSDDVLSSE